MDLYVPYMQHTQQTHVHDMYVKQMQIILTQSLFSAQNHKLASEGFKI